MENFVASINCVIPIFLILCTGLLVRRIRIVPEDFSHHLSTLSFRALLPCLLFYNIYSADFHEIAQPGLMIFLAGWLLLC